MHLLFTVREMKIVRSSAYEFERTAGSRPTQTDARVTARVHARCAFTRGSRRIYFRRGRIRTHHPLALREPPQPLLKATYRYLYTVVYSPRQR